MSELRTPAGRLSRSKAAVAAREARIRKGEEMVKHVRDRLVEPFIKDLSNFMAQNGGIKTFTLKINPNGDKNWSLTTLEG